MSAILSNLYRIRVDILKEEFNSFSSSFSRDNLFILVRFVTDAIKKVEKKPVQIIFPNISFAARARNYFGSDTIVDVHINSLENMEWKDNIRCIILVMPFSAEEDSRWKYIYSLIPDSIVCVLLNPQSKYDTQVGRFPHFSLEHYKGWKDYESVYFLHSFILIDSSGRTLQVVVYKKHPFRCKIYYRVKSSNHTEWHVMEWNDSSYPNYPHTIPIEEIESNLSKE
ncbi:hypothetical protein GAYE_SCF07G2845 [Galdieria yellowstonensis]|uniref:Uncharacterized protein n=1 Tax=Galdieria yellowstonensis TaxID=3028027 RepID=A0AAV9IC68_9RHOD|nr:hypothetical protein GAYE_SCF07G2845 [Galdieria yellowstonensis]